MGKNASQINPLVPKSTVLMQEEIRHTEADITDTLHSIEAKLAPQRLKAQAKEMLVNGTVNAAVHLGYAVKRKPLPSAALAVGLLWLMKRRSRRRDQLRRVDVGEAVLQALPKEMRKNPVRTLRKYITIGRLVFAFVSVAGAVMMRGKRAQQSLDRERYGEFGEYPAHL